MERRMNDLVQQWANPAFAAFATFVLAILSLAIAVLSLLYSNRLSRRMLAIEEHRDTQRRLHQQRAKLVASVSHDGRNAYRLVVRNNGESTATGIRIRLDDGDPCGHPAFPAQDLASIIGPTTSVEYVLAPSFSHPLPKKIEVLWCDDSGEPGRFESHL
jgi:hypothetical protein